MQEEAEEQEEVVRSVHVLAFDADDARRPQRTDGRLLHVVPRETTELKYVLHQYHDLQPQPKSPCYTVVHKIRATKRLPISLPNYFRKACQFGENIDRRLVTRFLLRARVTAA